MGRLIENMTAAIELSKTLTGEIDRANAAIPTVVEGGTEGGAGGGGGGDTPVTINFNEPGVNPQAFALSQRRTEDRQEMILGELKKIQRGVSGLGGGLEFRMKGS